MLKKIFLNYLGKKGLEIRRRYNGFCLNDNLEWLRKKSIKSVMDVGANDGQFALFARKLFPDSKIFSFEPLKSCYDKVLKISSGDENIKAFNFALGDADEEIEMFHDDFSPSSSLLKMGKEHMDNFPYTGKQTNEKVIVRRLDGLDDFKRVDKEVLMKIDVQGFELNVVRGAVDFINSHSPFIILEVSFADLYVNEPAFDELYSFMRSLGYSFCGVLDQLYSPKDGKVLQADVMFEKTKGRI